MRKFLFILSFCLFCLGESVVSGQTYAYRLVKLVSKYGETLEDIRPQKIYLTFTNGKSSFYISKSDGSRAGDGDASTGYASGFNNMDVSPNYSGVRSNFPVRDPQNFQFSERKGDVLIYKNIRPLLSINYNGFNRSVYISGYTVDYAKFNSDFSRINVIPSFEKGMYGLIPFGIGMSGYGSGDWTTFIFEQVKAPVIGGDML